MTFQSLAVASLLLGGMASAVAQTPPDAGSLLQQTQPRAPALPPQAPQNLAPPPAPMPSAPGMAVTVERFRFEGNTLLTDAVLAQAVAPYLQRPLDFQGLQSAALAVAEAYRRAGWIVRAYLPRQEIAGGVVTIQVVEAVFGGARVDPADAATTHVPAARALAYVERAQPTGAPLSADALDRALLLLDDLPGLTASGNLAAGAREGETALVLRLADEAWFSGDLGLDNAGNRSTGQARATANLALNSPARIGDQLQLNLMHTRGSDYARVGYTLPVGTAGWRVGANASHLGYELVQADFAPLQAKGDSSTVGLEASYPLLRSREKNLFLQINLDRKRFDNEANGATTSRYDTETLALGLAGNLFDNLGGGGANAGNLQLVHGRLDLDGSPNQAADAASTRAAGSFTKLRYGLSRQQVLSADLSLFASLSGQAASKNLDSSEKFYLGGLYGVRAYPTSEAGGSSGQLLNLELRWRLPQGFGLSGFYDWGRVQVNRDNGFVGNAAMNAYSMKGAGLALSWAGPARLNLKVGWARRIGQHPNPNISATGHVSDQDGSLHKHRFWLQASLPF